MRAAVYCFGLPLFKFLVRKNYLAAAVEHIYADMTGLKAVLKCEVASETQDVSVFAEGFFVLSSYALKREYVTELYRVKRFFSCAVNELYGGEHPAEHPVHTLHADDRALYRACFSLGDALLKARKVFFIYGSFYRISNVIAEIAEKRLAAALGVEALIYGNTSYRVQNAGIWTKIAVQAYHLTLI